MCTYLPHARSFMFPRPGGSVRSFTAKTTASCSYATLPVSAVAALYCDTTLPPQRFSKRLLERLIRQVASKRWEGSPRTASETKAAWVPSSRRGVQRDLVLGEPSSRAIGGQIHRAGRRPQAGSSKPLWWDPVCVVSKTCGLPFYRLSAETSVAEVRSRSFPLLKADGEHLR